jgi:hypothetical protein
MVLQCWRYMRARGWDTDAAGWSQAGKAQINLRRKRAARALLADWRNRNGVQMWMLANYLLSLPRLTQSAREEVIATCQDGLATLSHDHCAYYLAYMGAEACALSRDKEGLLAFWEQHSRYFSGTPGKEDFFPEWQRYLRHDIPVAVRSISEPAQKGYTFLLLKMHAARLWNPPVRARARQIFIFLARLLLVALASGSAILKLFQ